MSLRKSPTRTPALLDALRRNSQASTGPRTARGKAQSRLNGLRHGKRSPVRWQILMTLLDAPPGEIGLCIEEILGSEMARHRVIREDLETAVWAESRLVKEIRGRRAQELLKCFERGILKNNDRSRNVYDNE